MGSSISSLLGISDDESSEDYLQLTDLGGFLSKYIFIMLDKDKRKLVSKQEYLMLVNHFREQKTTEEELDNFLSRHVPGGQTPDYINESLFRKLIIQLAMDFDLNVGDRMKYLMTLFDKDGDGFVSEKDLQEVYDGIGIQVPSEPIKSLISKFDEDGDNRLSLAEFENLGRSAMSKLFVRKEERRSTEDILVEEALKKGSESLLASQQQSQTMAGESKEEADIINNNVASTMENMKGDQNQGFMVVDNVVFGKPVVLKDQTSTLFANVNACENSIQSLLGEGETSTNKVFLTESGDLDGASVIANMQDVLSELQVDGGNEQ